MQEMPDDWPADNPQTIHRTGGQGKLQEHDETWNLAIVNATEGQSVLQKEH